MNEENKIGYYAIIPAPVRYDNTLTDKAKILYGELTTFSNIYGYCTVDNKYLSEVCEISNRRVQFQNGYHI